MEESKSSLKVMDALVGREIEVKLVGTLYEKGVLLPLSHERDYIILEQEWESGEKVYQLIPEPSVVAIQLRGPWVKEILL